MYNTQKCHMRCVDKNSICDTWSIVLLMWCVLGYSVAVGEFNGDDDEGKECNHSADFLMC